MADTRPEKAHVVVDFGDGADGGARVAAGAFLVDGNRRGQAVDVVDVRFFHLAEELAGVRREGLNVATLALGEDRVERQRGLAGAGETGKDNELVSWDVDIDVFEVVLTSAANADVLVLWRHVCGIPCVIACRAGLVRLAAG